MQGENQLETTWCRSQRKQTPKRISRYYQSQVLESDSTKPSRFCGSIHVEEIA